MLSSCPREQVRWPTRLPRASHFTRWLQALWRICTSHSSRLIVTCFAATWQIGLNCCVRRIRCPSSRPGRCRPLNVRISCYEQYLMSSHAIRSASSKIARWMQPARNSLPIKTLTTLRFLPCYPPQPQCKIVHLTCSISNTMKRPAHSWEYFCTFLYDWI